MVSFGQRANSVKESVPFIRLRYEDNCKYAHSGGPSPGFTANVNPPPPPEKRELTAQEEETAAEALLSTPGMAKALLSRGWGRDERDEFASDSGFETPLKASSSKTP